MYVLARIYICKGVLFPVRINMLNSLAVQLFVYSGDEMLFMGG